MEDYLLVEMNAKGLGKTYDPIRKLVPESYKDRKFKDLVDFMCTEDEDSHGNSALMDLEKELAKEIQFMTGRTDPNYLVLIEARKDGKALEKEFSLTDRVGANPQIFEQKSDYTSDGDEIEYQSLDLLVHGYDAGGSR
ncbi:hypothetical protein COV93_05610 [Candidatus Woesearchaeota archaeon CG11_big_fil_rev_8_21_14_0_20_43_8]|nr:MAG: hypothetical protein COV93_05610 [Candidatus Woesearchaeota archaeon CG11_big_fil_rev_8_21_14_0_20_43_8]PIO08872.1 MAG: hypothetical protein COT47_00835 [Candidatus Woesearchaeota archaeon CG08_land_8_20_14_0_20_43_7]